MRAVMTVLGWAYAFLTPLLGLDIPRDNLNQFDLIKGIEVWVKEVSNSSQVACRFVTQDSLYGKPHIYPFDYPKDIFEEELPRFLDYCEEKVSEKKGVALGLVIVGEVDPTDMHHYLAKRYGQHPIEENFSDTPIQLARSQSQEIEVLLSYPKKLQEVNTDTDLKKLWAFYLIQSMAENRFKTATIEADGKWVAADETKCLLPTLTTVGHGIERFWSPSVSEDRLLKGYLSVVQMLKEKGFTENELADSKSKLMKHIHRFYDPFPDEIKLVEYFASHMVALIPCSNYQSFMENSFRVVPEINMTDISEALKDSFKDDSRQVLISQPEESVLTESDIKETLGQFESDKIDFVYTEPERVVIEAEKDAFFQLPITDNEQSMIKDIIQTVGPTSKVRLAWLRSDLEKKKMKLIHIHPLRSIAVMVVDPYTKQCLGEIMDDWVKRSSFMSDYNKRLDREAEKDNLMQFVPGFCLAVKANPEQVRSYIASGQWENLFLYLLKLSH